MESPPPCPNTVTARRNPHRKARATPSSTCPPVPQNSSKSAAVSSFPIQEILSMDVPLSQKQKPNPSDSVVPENLKVFLRIKPLMPSKSSGKNERPRSRVKNVWPQKPAKKNSARDMTTAKNKKTSEVCIAVNDSQSVTLSPPLLLQESKRIKSEVYEGFSHVFAADSSQEEVYEKMVSPLVEDFLKGKSGMLAAMGPSGSGKTHTVFGSPREPGMLTIALERIFKSTERLVSGSPICRSLYLSIFEIRTEGGKGEKLYDLSPEGAELTLHQSTIKGLQEVKVCDIREAESLVAKALLKRVTATTNSNFQSSRSQCIINIRSVDCKFDGTDDVQANNATLSIIDLAGAEREKRTGNQGARLLESNFINNTSMVFSLCLRSLLEHQKNPKRPLQKHFQNSLLTKYLRDYLEGKKRMALILTVKSGVEDYLDTAYVLRQASPFMKIKFDNVEEPQNIFCKKRQTQAMCRNEKPKKMKFGGLDAFAIEKGSFVDHVECFPGQAVKSNRVGQTQEDRNHLILQNFAKALWNVLKQYNEKLKVAEDDIQTLRENLKIEKAKRAELEKEIGNLKAGYTCSKESLVGVILADKSHMNLHPSNFEASECKCNSEKIDFTPGQDQETNVALDSSTVGASECNSIPRKNDSAPRQDQDIISQENVDLYSNIRESECSSSTPKQCEFAVRLVKDIFSQVQVEEHALSMDGRIKVKELTSPSDSKGFQSVDEEQDFVANVKEVTSPLDSKGLQSVDEKQDFDANEDFAPVGCTVVDALACEPRVEKPEEVKNQSPRVDSSSKPKLPKRRLLPASTALIRDFTVLDLNDEIEKPKGIRGGKKVAADERKRTPGSISLLRLLHGNHI
ncbi:kinesin-like protein KIN-6 isoform X2 [Ziziphus jujuba]|uniref:Kinesin-like protein n=1 Tax=Ziziphus jujuba TaxID=326968 RepID=A0A6P6G828_ZIZJJ|nr:kinesin-like protein KIN-6 isoform X2 [Ziziphus jujuba]